MKPKNLTEMEGKTYLVNSVYHKIKAVIREDDEIIIATDKKTFHLDGNLDKELKQFLEIDNTPGESEAPAEPRKQQNRELILSSLPNNDQFANLSTIILNSIDKIQNGEDIDIKKAGAINNTIRTMCNVAKLQLQIQKYKDTM